MTGGEVSGAAELASGKGHRNENFPVASRLIAPRHRREVLVFYRFARTADDVADSATASPAQKLELLSVMRETLVGRSDASPEALALRSVQDQLGICRQHGLDLLEAFRRDVTKLRYASWDELLDYCRFSAAPVGRFVLEVHGESPTIWPANDALCTALQVINHLQDCGKDYRDLDRVYLPLDDLGAAGASVVDLAAPRASPALRSVIVDLARRTGQLLDQARPFHRQIVDRRLAVEVAVIQRLAESLTARLLRRDPLSERVHHGKVQILALALQGAARALVSRGSTRAAAAEAA